MREIVAATYLTASTRLRKGVDINAGGAVIRTAAVHCGLCWILYIVLDVCIVFSCIGTYIVIYYFNSIIC